MDSEMQPIEIPCGHLHEQIPTTENTYIHTNNRDQRQKEKD